MTANELNALGVSVHLVAKHGVDKATRIAKKAYELLEPLKGTPDEELLPDIIEFLGLIKLEAGKKIGK